MVVVVVAMVVVFSAENQMQKHVTDATDPLIQKV